MRTQIIGLGLLLSAFLAAPTFAGEYDRNPDRFPSLGITLDLGGASGDATLTASGASAKQDVASGLASLALDTRIPVSQSVTLSAGLALFGNASEADETALLSKQEVNQSGFNLTLGMRYYFNQ
jgi:hypothetical protein